MNARRELVHLRIGDVRRIAHDTVERLSAERLEQRAGTKLECSANPSGQFFRVLAGDLNRSKGDVRRDYAIVAALGGKGERDCISVEMA